LGIKFRHSAGFGRRIEYWIIGQMLRENLDVYVPLVDDFGVDAVIRKKNNSFVEVQIKARSENVVEGNAALFAGIQHPEKRENYYFIFYSERLEKIWIMSSEQFIDEAAQNKNGINKGKRSTWFNGTKKDPKTKEKIEYPRSRYDKYLASDFSTFREAAGLALATPEPDISDTE